jgi:hypothetical protein
LVMTLDADLQDDPNEVPRFLEAMTGDVDLVSGWKKVRHDPWHKVVSTRIFNRAVSLLTGVKLHDHNCGMKCYRREIFHEVRLYGQLHRFVTVLAAARGYRVGEIVIHHRPRRFGKSKYGFKRIFQGALDLMTVKFLTGFGQRPQHLLGAVGAICLVLAVALLWTAGWSGVAAGPERLALFVIALAAFILGGVLLAIGSVAELIAAHHGRDNDPFSVAERTPRTVDEDSSISS